MMYSSYLMRDDLESQAQKVEGAVLEMHTQLKQYQAKPGANEGYIRAAKSRFMTIVNYLNMARQTIGALQAERDAAYLEGFRAGQAAAEKEQGYTGTKERRWENQAHKERDRSDWNARQYSKWSDHL
jgi:hypothetical protein